MADVRTIGVESRGDSPSINDEVPNAGNDRSLVVRPPSQSFTGRPWYQYPLLAAGLALVLSPLGYFWPGESPIDATNYAERTRRVLRTTPYVTPNEC